MQTDLIDKQLHLFISIADLPVSSLHWSEKDGDNIRMIVVNKHINGLEINLEYVMIIFNHRFSVFNVSCGPWSIFMVSALRQALKSTSGHNKH